MFNRCAGFGLMLALAACGGTPATHFYTLAPTVTTTPVTASPGLIVAIGQITLPLALDRNAFVTQVGPEQLDVSSQDRWAAPLDDIVRRVLAADLSSRMPGAIVLAPGDPVPAGEVHTLDVNLRQFIGNRDGRVTLDATWFTRGVGEIRGLVVTRQAKSSQNGAVAAAMSGLLGELSDHIAAGIARVSPTTVAQ